MPLYEYTCRACGETFERMRRATERMSAPACPTCASAQTSLVMSAPGMVGAGASRSAQSAAPACEAGLGACCGGACMH